MRKALIIIVLLAAGLFTMNAAYAGKSNKKVTYVNSVQNHNAIQKLGVTWNWNGNAGMTTDDM